MKCVAAIAAMLLPPAAAPDALPDAVYLVLSPSDALAADTRRTLAAMHDLGLIRYRVSALTAGQLRACLGDDYAVADDAVACLRRALPVGEAGLPVVTVVVGYTRARGAWQHMQCLGPGGLGNVERIYVAEALYGDAGRRARVRSGVLACLDSALAAR